ncbi:DeoR family transcriptional regulator [Halobacillus halophilus]|uniref:DeoR/GlpR family DNA-binding transcription regulator n=1 Tax=Halobacillus halophilus TaxID=1570 RepID=UPI001368CE74|nr:DeoR/GlpR family DNA-binding transcription regulator [Halobacillus halophilus]MYL31414.1 DeoR family transcriptional regulator [Halobacillus halophilus]
MLTHERHERIIETVKNNQTASIKKLVEVTQASESTIRRDLDELEKQGHLRRVHGGASIKQSAADEPAMKEKQTKYQREKRAIASYAASFVKDGDSIFVDAGSTTYEMIPFLKQKDIIVVTNGLDHLLALTEHGIRTYVLGGLVKSRTGAVVGAGALQNLKQYRFDNCFMGVNGITLEDGFTTPDPEEAAIKQRTLQISRERFILADHTKFGETSFIQFADIHEADIITNNNGTKYKDYAEKTNIKVVTT